MNVGRPCGVLTPANEAIVGTVHAINRGHAAPDPTLLGLILEASR
jgi:hypothetical protein